MWIITFEFRARKDIKVKIEIGISGWTYQGWRGIFYPNNLPLTQELEFASHAFPTIEVNGTFYGLQAPQTYINWYKKTPDDFIFSLKANRYITHIKMLTKIEVPLANFFASGPLKLKEKLGPILWQFPQKMIFNPDKLEAFLALLPRNFSQAAKLAQIADLMEERIDFSFKINYPIKHAIEVRDYSFLNPWFIELLRKYNVALVFADTAGEWPYFEDITSDFVYIRLHGDSQLYVSGYDDKTLNFWLDRILLWSQGREPKDRLTITDDFWNPWDKDIFVYFDNDAKVRAPVDAQSLIQKVNQHQS